MESIITQVVGVEMALAALIAGGIAFPRSQTWPPPRLLSWQWLVAAMLVGVTMWGVLALGVLDWNRGPLPSEVRFGLGLPLLFGGEALAIWSITVLGLRNAMGSMERLVTEGPYRVSRNPEYLGESAALLGWAVLSNSLMAFTTTVFLVACLFLAVRAEEEALAARFGDLYRDYERRVTRFLRPSGGSKRRKRWGGLT